MADSNGGLLSLLLNGRAPPPTMPKGLLGQLLQPQTPGAFGNNPMAMDTGGQPIPPTPKWAKFLMNSGNAMASAVTAPGRAMQGQYDLMVNPATGENYYAGMAEDAGGLAGLLTLGAGAVPRAADTLNMGMRLFHGSPEPNLAQLRPSERGPLGPGVYGTPHQPLAEQYSRGGSVYQFDAPDEVFHGTKPWMADSGYNQFAVWREQMAKLVEAAPADKKPEIAKMAEKLWPEDGYRLFGDISRMFGSKEDAQNLFRKAGYKGISAFIDGPEVLLFDPVDLPQPSP